MNESPDELIPTRQSLLSRLKDWDDEESWREFFNTYWRLIYGVAVKAGLSDAEAQDAVQETVLEVAKKMPGFKYDPSVGSFRGWLLRTTQWKISGQFKQRKRERRPLKLLEDGSTTTAAIERVPDPATLDWSSLWDEEWERSLFESAMESVKRKVSPSQFEMFYLSVLKEMPVKEVAATLEVSTGRVYLAKHRISALLKNEVKKFRKKMV